MLNPIEKEAIARVDEHVLVATLQALIEARSDYPPGDTREAIAVIGRQLSEAGVAYQCYAKDPVRQSLVATIGNPDAERTLLYHAHIDTVPAGDESRWDWPPFLGTVAAGRIYGRGAGDDKGSVTVQLAALRALATAETLQDVCIKAAFVADEESGGEYGTRWLYQQGLLDCDCLVVGEQTDNQISVAERVTCGIDLTVFGKSAHGATPWEGENAVLKTARVLTYLVEHMAPTLEAKSHPYLPPPTLNVGRIEGGIQWNIVPEACRVAMDRRLIPGETRAEAMAEIRFILDQFASQVEPLHYHLSSEGDIAPNIDTDPKHPFIKMASESLAEIVGEERPLSGYALTSDGRWLAGEGIPIIHFGPGHPRQAHAANEFVHINQLLEAAQFLTLLGLRWQI